MKAPPQPFTYNQLLVFMYSHQNHQQSVVNKSS